MSIRLVAILFIISASNSLTAGEIIGEHQTVRDVPGIIDLGMQGRQLGDVKNTYTVPLNIDSVPQRASLNLKFVVVTTGTCPASYFPTEVFLNDESIASIDFRELDEGSKQDLRIELPTHFMKRGSNTLRIVTGSCNEGLDSMQFNGIQLAIDGSS